MKINMTQLKCQRCGHIWTPRNPEVRICPKCKSAWWDVPKKAQAGQKVEEKIDLVDTP